MKLLLVEDSLRLQRAIQRGLGREGFALDVASDGEEGLFLAETQDYDAIILDLMIPKIDGLTLLKTLRKKGVQTHVLILSAKDQVDDRIKGLEFGADDYLIKPFDFKELVARLRALIRRRYERKSPWIEIGSLRINLASQEVFIEEKPITLSAKEFAILEYLLMRRGRIASRQNIIDHLYDGYGDIGSNVIDVTICNVRRKINVPGEPNPVETRRGVGYFIR